MSSSRFQPKALLTSLLISYLISGILLLLLSFAVWKMQISEQMTGTLILGVYALSCLVGGFASARLIRSRRFFWGLLTGLLYVLVLVAVSWLFGQEESRYSSRLISIVICCAVSGMIGVSAGLEWTRTLSNL